MRLPSLLLALCIVLFSQLPSVQSCWADFSLYPLCAQPYLCDTASTACDYGVVGEEFFESLDCLCADGSWLTGVAQAVGANCGCADLEQTANTASAICQGYGQAIPLTPAEVIKAGNCDASNTPASSPTPVVSTTSASVTTPSPSITSTSPIFTTPSSTTATTSPTPTPTNNGSLSTSDKIALGVGIGVGLPGALLATYQIYLYLKGNRQPQILPMVQTWTHRWGPHY